MNRMICARRKGPRAENLMSREEELEAVARRDAGDRSGSDELVTRNTGIVYAAAKRYARKLTGDHEDDLVGAGMIGLVNAATKYQPSRRTKFVTYASIHIKKHMMIFIHSQMRLVVLPRYASQALSRRSRGMAVYRDSGAKYGHLWDRKILFDSQAKEEDDITVNSLADRIDPGGDDLADLFPGWVKSALDSLPGVEADIVRKLFGLDGRPPMTTGEIAREMGYCRASVWQIYRTAMIRMRGLATDEMLPLMNVPLYPDGTSYWKAKDHFLAAG